MIEQTLIVFWQYGIEFPYCLWGEAESFDVEGRAVVKGYSGRRFKPFLILPAEAAAPITSQLCILKEEKRAAFVSLEKEYVNNLKQIITIPGRK